MVSDHNRDRRLASVDSAKKPVRDLVQFFVLAFVLTWAGQLPAAAASHGLLPFPVPPAVGVVAAFGPALAALLLTGIRFGRRGLAELLGRLFRWRASPSIYLVALAGPVAISAMAIGLTALSGGGAPDYAHAMIRQLGISGATPWLLLPLLFVVMAVGPDGLGEELGWRGFALPRMLEQMGAVRASLLLGAIWAAWHLPTLWGKGDLADPRYVGLFVVEVLANSIIATCLFLRSRGSVLLPVIFHAAGNTAWAVAPIDYHADHSLYLMSLALRWALAVGVLVLMARGPDSGPLPDPRTRVAQPDGAPKRLPSRR